MYKFLSKTVSGRDNWMALVLLISVVTTLLVPSASAYNFVRFGGRLGRAGVDTGTVGNHDFRYSWDKDVLTWYLDRGELPVADCNDAEFAALKARIQPELDKWALWIRASFSEAANLAAADVLIRFVAGPAGADTIESEFVGVTLTKTLIRVNPYYTDWSQAAGRNDFAYIILHEWGHVLGLGDLYPTTKVDPMEGEDFCDHGLASGPLPDTRTKGDNVMQTWVTVLDNDTIHGAEWLWGCSGSSAIVTGELETRLATNLYNKAAKHHGLTQTGMTWTYRGTVACFVGKPKVTLYFRGILGARDVGPGDWTPKIFADRVEFEHNGPWEGNFKFEIDCDQEPERYGNATVAGASITSFTAAPAANGRQTFPFDKVFGADCCGQTAAAATSPGPPDGSWHVSPVLILTWIGPVGILDPTFHVYFGTDFDGVYDANRFSAEYQGETNEPNFPALPELELDTSYFWRVDVNDPNEGGNPVTHKGIVWTFTTGGHKACCPAPESGGQDAGIDVTLSWKPGYGADYLHDVYFGTSFGDVNDADTTDTTGIYQTTLPSGGNTGYEPWYHYGPPELGRTYYWRIDQVNAAHPSSPWKGDVWTFTTAHYLVVDDFEDYNDATNPISYTWRDGSGNGTGSVVYLGTFEWADPLHGGRQSMIFFYFNAVDVGAGYYSEVEASAADLETGSDWTASDAKALTLYFYGDPNNDANATEQMYVALGDADSNAVVKYGDYPGEDMSDIKKQEWQEWNIALTDFSGITLTAVKRMYIGFGDRDNHVTPGGWGGVYFDDIRLYLPRCIPSRLKPIADLSDNCIVDMADLRVIADNWLDSVPAEIDLYHDGDMNLKDYAVLADNWLKEGFWPGE
ncbi:MAG TPA: hypothetical protein VMW16_00910 [Sedimentisphaerales bacterium]|nr:hypothetical protein [Sedimentisphaerales bacterium]